MKRLAFLASLSLFCQAASANFSSPANVTPPKTLTKSVWLFVDSSLIDQCLGQIRDKIAAGPVKHQTFCRVELTKSPFNKDKFYDYQRTVKVIISLPYFEKEADYTEQNKADAVRAIKKGQNVHMVQVTMLANLKEFGIVFDIQSPWGARYAQHNALRLLDLDNADAALKTLDGGQFEIIYRELE